MILTCPLCTTRWTVKPKDLEPSNRMVRCSNCGHTWLPDTREEESELTPDFLVEAPKAEPEHLENLEVTEDEFGSFLDQDVTSQDVTREDVTREEKAEESLPPERAADMALPDDATNAPPMPTYGAFPTETLSSSETEMISKNLAEEIPLVNVRKPEYEKDLSSHPVVLSPPRSRQGFVKPPARSVKKARSRSWLGWFFLGFVCLGTVAGIYFGRATIIRFWPPAAVAYARAGLSFGFAGEGFDLTDVIATRRDANGVLVIQGRLLNVTDSAKPKPKLKATVYGPGDQRLKEWFFSGPALLPKASGTFQADLAGLPKPAEKLIVTFADE